MTDPIDSAQHDVIDDPEPAAEEPDAPDEGDEAVESALYSDEPGDPTGSSGAGVADELPEEPA